MSGSPQYSAESVGQLIAGYQEQQRVLTERVAQLSAQLAASQSQQSMRASPSFSVQKVKLDLPPQFDGKPSAMSAWIFAVEQYCMLVGLASPQDMVKLAVSRLTKDAFTWWRGLAARGVDYSLGALGWSDFKNELVDAFQDVDRELKLRRKLQSLRQQTSVAQYTKDFRTVVLELGEQAPDDSALLFMYTEGLKPDVQMQVLLARPTLLTEAETIAERADMALFARRRPQAWQHSQRPQQQQQQSRFKGQRFRYQQPPQPPPRNGPVPMELGFTQGGGQQRQQQRQQPRQQRQQSAGQDRPPVVCYRCGKQGHMVRTCRVRLDNQQGPRAYHVQSSQGPQGHVQHQYGQQSQQTGGYTAQGHQQQQPPPPPQLNYVGGSY